MKTKNFLVEVIEKEDGSRTFIIRVPSPQGAQPVLITSDSSEVAEFLSKN